MASGSTTLHESADKLSPQTIDRHRAIVSIMEELEAVDWYDQRLEAADDPQLREILTHNRDEEKEHAMMTLEWLRRHDPELDKHMRTYLFTDKPVLDIEEEAEHGGGEEDAKAPRSGSSGRLSVGSLRQRRSS
jgi:uncharacterized protein